VLGVVLNRVRGRAAAGGQDYRAVSRPVAVPTPREQVAVPVPREQVAVPAPREQVAVPAPGSRRAARAAARPARLRRAFGRRGRQVTALSPADLLAAIAGSQRQGGSGPADVGPQAQAQEHAQAQAQASAQAQAQEHAQAQALAALVQLIDVAPVDLDALPAALLGTLPADEARDLLAPTSASDLLDGGLPSTAIQIPTQADDVDYGFFDELSMDRTGHDLPQSAPPFSRSLAEATAALSAGREHPQESAEPRPSTDPIS
jgi:hypothetical protein